LFARVSLISYPNRALNSMAGLALSYETARSSQKSVMRLLRNCHLTT